jgi:hypothetical protein
MSVVGILFAKSGTKVNMQSINKFHFQKPFFLNFADLALRMIIFMVHISSLSALIISNHQNRNVVMPNKSTMSRTNPFLLEKQVLKLGGQGHRPFGSNTGTRLKAFIAALSVARAQGGCPEDKDDIRNHRRSDDTFDHDESRCAQKWRRREVVRIAKFGLPALSITLADPLMSFVDAVCIGRGGTTLEVLGHSPKPCLSAFTRSKSIGHENKAIN